MMKAIITFFLIMLTGSAAADSMIIQLNSTDSSFEVTLPANPSTGYRWSVKSYDQELLRLVSSKYVAAQPQLIGSGGNMIYEFELLNGVAVPKLTSLVFSYARPWEREQETIQTVTVMFKTHSITPTE
ncbi:protease inhibitor I42 family protein [Legionella dresdenensis]|uniref:Protease inhibitor I42 family protein n=1 Tax=Legionella dresdenensis TaxID=450200 RepID=A0ABV8CHB7_9GAMM